MPWERRLLGSSTFAWDTPEVRAKPRPTVSKYGKGVYYRNGYPAYARELKDAMKHQLGTAWSDWPGEVRVRLTFYRKYPDSRPRYREGEPDTIAPDVDNLAKSVLDAAKGVAWADDAQVTYLSVAKSYRYARQMDRIEMAIEYWDNVPKRKGAGS